MLITLFALVFSILSHRVQMHSLKSLEPVVIPSRVLIVVAHPDDVVDTSGGTIYNWVSKHGTQVFYLVLTNGDKGYQGSLKNMTCSHLAELRQTEEVVSASVFGIPFLNVAFGGYEDGELDRYDPNEVRKLIVKHIRTVRPDLVLTFDPYIDFAQFKNGKVHPDHQTTGSLTLGAVYPLARDWLAFQDLQLDTWEVPRVYLFQWDAGYIDIYSDIGDVMDTKVLSYSKHKTQYTSLQVLEAYVKKTASDIAQQIQVAGVSYAEAFQEVVFSV